MPDESMMAQLSGIDVMLIPIGGTYTIDTPEAEELIRAAKPRIAVAMHFKTGAYEIKITTCEAFKKDMMAANMPNEIEITEGNISKLPPVIIMDYK
jgi:L-ascorbate metabolism protein UlaG (beta-lactamase superfamily)